mmetsp:Transcript_46526/g.109353  ORF Transcript_46526/g.109353 Transcript_46526/m.109353 type:complete len:212 (-) Transcript_46526:586-1221(-)
MFCLNRFWTSMILVVACSPLLASLSFSATSTASARCCSSCSNTSAGSNAVVLHVATSSSDALPFSTLLSATSCSRTLTACVTTASCSEDSSSDASRAGACLARKVRRLSRVESSLECCASSNTTSSTSSCAASATWNRLKLAVALTTLSVVVMAKPPCCALAVWSRYSFGTLRSEELLAMTYLVASSVRFTTRTRSLLPSFSSSPPPAAPG